MRAVVWVAALAGVVLAGASAWAEDPIGRISFGGSAGISNLAMDDVNQRIREEGNHFLEDQHVPRLKPIESLEIGWTFWGDLKVPVPTLDSFFLTVGYGIQTAATQGPDVDNLIEIKAAQRAYHVRLLYSPPFRFHEDVRLFVGGGPLIIRAQDLTISQNNRTVADEEWAEEITYKADGIGWQICLAGEYMIQDRLTLSFDAAYRIASLEYGSWDANNNVEITRPAGSEEEERDRLSYDHSYPGHAFLDWETTVRNGEAFGDADLEIFGPNRTYMVPVPKSDLGIDMTGLQLHVGFRFYIL